MDSFIQELERANKSVAELRTLVLKHMEQQEFVEGAFPPFIWLGLVSIDCKAVRSFISEKHEQVATRILQHLTTRLQSKSEHVTSHFESMQAKVLAEPNTIEELTRLRNFLVTVPEEIEVIKPVIDEVREVLSELESCKFDVTDTDFSNALTAVLWPAKIATCVTETEAKLADTQDRFLSQLEGEEVVFVRDLKEIESKVKDFGKFDDLSKVGEVSLAANRISAKLDELDQTAKKFRSRTVLFGKDPDDYEQLGAITKAFAPYAALWSTAAVWLKRKEEWYNGTFLEIDADELEAIVNDSFKIMFKSARTFKTDGVEGCASIAMQLKGEIEEFKPFVPVVKALRGAGVRDRHWEDLTNKLNEAATEATEEGAEPPAPRVIDREALTLKICVEDLKMAEPDFLPAVLSVSEVASKEHGIEKMLDKMLGLWEEVKYTVQAYRATGTYVIKGTDDINTLLDDHIVATQARLAFSAC